MKDVAPRLFEKKTPTRALSRLRRLAPIALVGALVFLIVGPIGLETGVFDGGPYRGMVGDLQRTSNAKVLLFSSYDDFYNLPSNFWLRNEIGEAKIERGYDEVLSNASLGNQSFNQYLRGKGVTHLLAPLSTDIRGSIFHKFGAYGSIRLKLSAPFFQKVRQTGGDFPVVLYKVLAGTPVALWQTNILYELKWHGVREEFNSLIREQAEVGFYHYSYRKHYDDGEDVSWVFKGETPTFSITTAENSNTKFIVSLVLAAAYGSNAPAQIVVVKTPRTEQKVQLLAGKPVSVSLQLGVNERVKLTNFLPCHQPITFDPSGGDPRSFCYGVINLEVRVSK